MEKDYQQALAEHLYNRDWSETQVANIMHKVIGRFASASAEVVLDVLEIQQEVDENIAAQKEHDRWAIGRRFLPVAFFEDTQYRLPDAEGEALEAKWDEVGKYLGNAEDRDI
jgi:hypothetical protein